MIEPSTVLNLLIVGVLYNLALTFLVIRAVMGWRTLLEQREQELERCKMELKEVKSRRI